MSQKKLTQEEVNNYREQFNRVDADRSGSIDIHELAKLARSLGFTNDQEICQMFLAGDRDGDKKISFNEYLGLMGQVPYEQRTEAQYMKEFDDMDKDKSGCVTKGELVAYCKKKNLDDETANEIISKADCSGDGKLSKKEFMAAMRK